MPTPRSHTSATAMPDDAAIAAETTGIIRDHDATEGALLPILHAVQARFGHVPAAAHTPIAAALNITRAELHGVLSFYHDFRDRPAGRHVLKICRAEACQAMGGAALGDRMRDMLGVDWHGTTPDGQVTLEPVYCLGLCACAPAAMLDGQPMGRVDTADLRAALESGS